MKPNDLDHDLGWLELAPEYRDPATLCSLRPDQALALALQTLLPEDPVYLAATVRPLDP